jgi:hypothetical protein
MFYSLVFIRNTSFWGKKKEKLHLSFKPPQFRVLRLASGSRIFPCQGMGVGVGDEWTLVHIRVFGSFGPRSLLLLHSVLGLEAPTLLPQLFFWEAGQVELLFNIHMLLSTSMWLSFQFLFFCERQAFRGKKRHPLKFDMFCSQLVVPFD